MHVLTSLVLAMAIQSVSPTPAAARGLTFEGEEAEELLRTATVVSVRSFKTRAGTRPKKVEMSDGERTAFAVFKTIDESEVLKHFDDSTVEFQCTDCFKYEITAYQLDELLGLGIVPPTVRRRINQDVGSLSLGVEGAMTEDELEQRLEEWLNKRQIESLWVRRNLILEF